MHDSLANTGVKDMLEYAKANLNDYIKVKLTEYGRMIYRESFVSLGLQEPKINVDEEGYTRFQIWEFMQTFGDKMRMGHELPCDTNVEIQIKVEEPVNGDMRTHQGHRQVYLADSKQWVNMDPIRG